MIDYQELTLPGVLLIKPQIHHDSRGFFLESFRLSDYHQLGIGKTFVQENHSRSCQGVIRGLHYQLHQPQGKLVRVSRGKVIDVIVDVRVSSPTFGCHETVVLSDDNHYQVYIPPGYAHGVGVLSKEADLHYKCTDYYNPQDEYGISWCDKQLQIEWGIENPIISTKDSAWISLAKQANDNLPLYLASSSVGEQSQ